MLVIIRVNIEDLCFQSNYLEHIIFYFHFEEL